MLLILADAICGGVAGLIGAVLSKTVLPASISPRVRQIVLILTVVVGFQLGQHVVSPKVKAWQMGRELDDVLAKEPFFSIIFADHPEIRPRIRNAMLDAYAGGNRDRAMAVARAMLGPLLGPYLARGSSESLVKFTERMVVTLRAIEKADPNDCYYYLRPDAAHQVTPSKAQGRDELFAAMRDVVLSTKNHAQREEEDKSHASELLQQVSANLRKTYGDDLGLVQEMKDPETDRPKVCRISISTFDEILKLPQAQAGTLLRATYGE